MKPPRDARPLMPSSDADFSGDAPFTMPHPDDSTAHRRMLGRYEIVGRIATGGMATVYLGRLQGTGGFDREFALKVVHPHLTEEPGFGDRFLREARLASRVRHHNIVSTIDAGQALGYSFLVLELVEGLTLRQLGLHRDRPFGFVEAAQIVADAARGLHALHRAENADGEPLAIVHRDLSPQNIMIDRHGRTVLIDLGLAKARENAETTQVGVMIGKLPYMSPEQAQLQDIDARSDIFALGSVLFELVTGQVPFGDSHTTETLERLVAAEPGPVAERLSEHEAPTWFIEAVLTCLRVDPDERFASAEALADALTQELQRAGNDAPDNRRQLAQIVVAAMPEVGGVSAVEGIVPRDPPVQSPRGFAWWRWAFGGAAAAGAGLLALHLAGRVTARTAAPAPRSDPAGLASDAAEPPLPSPATIPDARPVPPARAQRSASTDTTGEPHADTDTGASEDPPARSRRPPRKSTRPTPLKPNPYDRQ